MPGSFGYVFRIPNKDDILQEDQGDRIEFRIPNTDNTLEDDSDDFNDDIK